MATVSNIKLSSLTNNIEGMSLSFSRIFTVQYRFHSTGHCLSTMCSPTTSDLNNIYFLCQISSTTITVCYSITVGDRGIASLARTYPSYGQHCSIYGLTFAMSLPLLTTTGLLSVALGRDQCSVYPHTTDLQSIPWNVVYRIRCVLYSSFIGYEVNNATVASHRRPFWYVMQAFSAISLMLYAYSRASIVGPAVQ